MAAGKMAVLVQLLHEVINGCQERVVVCSSSTQCLGLVATICCSLGLSTVRIDGATDASKRQDIVDAFNTCNIGQVLTYPRLSQYHICSALDGSHALMQASLLAGIIL